MNAPARSFGMFGTYEKSAAAGWCHAPPADVRMTATSQWVSHLSTSVWKSPKSQQARYRYCALSGWYPVASTLDLNPGRDPSLSFHPAAGEPCAQLKHHLIPENVAVNSHVWGKKSDIQPTLKCKGSTDGCYWNVNKFCYISRWKFFRLAWRKIGTEVNTH